MSEELGAPNGTPPNVVPAVPNAVPAPVNSVPAVPNVVPAPVNSVPTAPNCPRAVVPKPAASCACVCA